MPLPARLKRPKALGPGLHLRRVQLLDEPHPPKGAVKMLLVTKGIATRSKDATSSR